MKAFVIDIETIGRADAAEYLPEVTAPANYKDAAKIDAYIAEKRASQLEGAALSAQTGQILCVGIARRGETSCIYPSGEKEILRATWVELESREADEVFVTFNGNRFDWPMLARRSYALGVTVPAWFPRDGRWLKRTHCDLLEQWQCGDRSESISLDRLARLLGFQGKNGDGARFGQLWAEDRKAALAYLRRDLELTAKIFERMNWDRMGGITIEL